MLMRLLWRKRNYFFDQGGDKQAGMVQTSVPNEDIKWETTRSHQCGP